MWRRTGNGIGEFWEQEWHGQIGITLSGSMTGTLERENGGEMGGKSKAGSCHLREK